jgi:hypothetical protein
MNLSNIASFSLFTALSQQRGCFAWLFHGPPMAASSLRRFFWMLVMLLIPPVSGEESPSADAKPSPTKGVDIARDAGATCLSEPSSDGLKVLILGDSMALSGFAETLDASFRSCPGVAAVHTVGACGTNPLSWLKAAPYSRTMTRCGFIELETTKNGVRTKKDIYGMKRGHKPAPHRIPKIEDLIKATQPDILVFQCGNNFFDLFKHGKTVNQKAGNTIKAHVVPLARWIGANAPSVKRWYWVSPPEAGNITDEVQEFIFENIQLPVAGLAVMLDSRQITSYPYPSQDRDRMHFWGQAANDWGRDTFRLISKDLSGVDLSKLPSVVSLASDKQQQATDLTNSPAPPTQTTAAAPPLRLRAKLVAMSATPAPEVFAPYGEFLVGYLYEVLNVESGSYSEKQLLVLHPAYIKHSRQDLSHLKLGGSYNLEVAEVQDDSLWSTTHRSDTVASPDLFPHLLARDLERHPDAPGCGCLESENTSNQESPPPKP